MSEIDEALTVPRAQTQTPTCFSQYAQDRKTEAHHVPYMSLTCP